MFGTIGYDAISDIREPQPELSFHDQGDPALVAGGDVGNHFFPLQFSGDDEADPFQDLHDVAPVIAGDDRQPDIKASVELVAAHVAPDDIGGDVDGLTFRLDVGQNEMGRNGAEPLYWTVAAGASSLLQALTGTRGKGGAPPFRIAQSLHGRPIELPQGLGTMRFEIGAHPQVPRWRSLFRLASDPAAERLAGALGFPGIALEGVKLIDEFLANLLPEGKPLIQSQRLSIAFSARGREHFCMGVPGVSVGVVNPGYVLLMRARDLPIVRDDPPVFRGGEGRLVSRAAIAAGKSRFRWDDNPYNNVSYAVLRVRARSTNLREAV